MGKKLKYCFFLALALASMRCASVSPALISAANACTNAISAIEVAGRIAEKIGKKKSGILSNSTGRDAYVADDETASVIRVRAGCDVISISVNFYREYADSKKDGPSVSQRMTIDIITEGNADLAVEKYIEARNQIATENY